MGVDDLHSGAAHHSDFAHGAAPVGGGEDGLGGTVRIGFLVVIFLSFFLCVVTLFKLAGKEKEAQEIKDR